MHQFDCPFSSSDFFVFHLRDVDAFIKNLQETISFFRNLDTTMDGGSDEDDFVPFI